MNERKKSWPVLMFAALAFVFTALYVSSVCFGPNTCGASDEELVQYLERDYGRKNITLLKTAQKGRIRAALYQDARWDDPDKGLIVIFERRLFGLRWRQVGMDAFTLGEDRLYSTYAWCGGRCDVEIYGDVRGGTVAGYAMPDVSEVQRDGLEEDFILDIYTLHTAQPPDRRLEVRPAEQ